MSPKIPNPPILLLKTKSTPHDGYDDYFSTKSNNNIYTPIFIPVLEHQFHDTNLAQIRTLFESGQINPGPGRKYGGLIFTSQRAVEAFAHLLSTIDESVTHPASTNLVLYTVGPATTRSLTTLRDKHLPHATIHGGDSAGTGEKLAELMLTHYNELYASTSSSAEPEVVAAAAAAGGNGEKKDITKPPLLFLVGEQRRDIIPKMLMGEATAEEKRIGVDELVVYQTGVVEGFEGHLEGVLQQCESDGYLGSGRENGRGDIDSERYIWVVVFSPTGCDAMLRVLGRYNNDDNRDAGREQKGKKRVYVATIGPTTRDHLVHKYGVEPEVCAKRPSPEGVGEAIEEFMKNIK